jgi:hypothetical protein
MHTRIVNFLLFAETRRRADCSSSFVIASWSKMANPVGFRVEWADCGQQAYSRLWWRRQLAHRNVFAGLLVCDFLWVLLKKSKVGVCKGRQQACLIFTSVICRDKCLERINERHFWNPGVFRYAMIIDNRKMSPQLRIFFSLSHL